MAKKPAKPPIQPLRPGTRSYALLSSHEKLIGRVVISWSMLENAIEHLIWVLFNLDIAHGRIITAKLAVEGRLQMLKALAELAYKGQTAIDVKELISRIEIVKDDRNAVVHGTWGRTEISQDGYPQLVPNVLSMRVKDDPYLVVGETFPPQRLQTLHQTIIQLRLEIQRFQKDRSAQLPVRPDWSQ